MARGRMIASTVATDKRFNLLSSDAALVYLMTIPHLDRDGLILGDAMPLWGKVCPRRNEYMSFMEEIIIEWVKSGLVIAYTCEDGRVLYFVGFGKNQTGMRYDREAPSVFPPPPNHIRTSNGIEKRSDGASTEEVRSDAGATPDEIPVKAKQSKLKETGGGSWQEVIDTYQHEIGTFTETISEEVKEYYDDIGGIMLIDAIKESARANIRKWSYVDGILKKWRVSGRQPPNGNGNGGADAWQQLNSSIPDYMEQ